MNTLTFSRDKNRWDSISKTAEKVLGEQRKQIDELSDKTKNQYATRAKLHVKKELETPLLADKRKLEKRWNTAKKINKEETQLVESEEVKAKIFKEYAPYHTFKEFHHGYEDYHSGKERNYEGVGGQAYDRGSEAAMRYQRHLHTSKMKNEEIELDELKKETIGRYAKKATGSLASSAYILGREQTFGKSGKEHQRKVYNRQKGLDNAHKKLAEDQLDESKNYHSVFSQVKGQKWSHHFDADSKEDAHDEMNSIRNQGDKVVRLTVPKHEAKWNKMSHDQIHDYVEGRIKKKTTNEEVEFLNEKNWIQGAIKHPGRMKRAAASAGESTHEYEEKHKHSKGSLGRAARLGLTLGKMH